MNLSKLFEMQKVLDEKIELEKPPQPGEDRLAKKILALQVELGELANEWRGFKFWSKDQMPRTKDDYLSDPNDVWSPLKTRNPLLEEYVDCLHFILSVGLAKNMQNETFEYIMLHARNCQDITIQFLRLTANIGDLFVYRELKFKLLYWEILGSFIKLGEMLGFTWEQIEQAYMSKNEVNHQRQATGY